MKRAAAAATVAIGLHLILFSLDVGRNRFQKLHQPPLAEVTIDLVAARPRIAGPSPAANPAPLKPPESDVLPQPNEKPIDAASPKRVQTSTTKSQLAPKIRAPAAPPPRTPQPKSVHASPSAPPDQRPVESSQAEFPAEEEPQATARPAGSGPPADATPADSARQSPAMAVQEATPDYERNPPPEYPRRARQLGFEGTVLLHVRVNQSGGVDQADIAASSGYAMLDDSALRAVKAWMFKPARQGGQPVAAWVQVPVRFTLSSSTDDRR